jgi:hypothetical protein
VSEISIDYTDCQTATSDFVNIPDDQFSYSISEVDPTKHMVPRYKRTEVTLENNLLPGAPKTAITQANRCTINLEIPIDMKPPVFMYYRLTGFYQNHRKYVKSFDADQLKGVARTYNELSNGNCIDLAGPDDGSGRVYYPCGLIANSIFNDTISLTLIKNDEAENNPAENLTFTDKGIAWSSDKDKYGKTSYTDLSKVLPPPHWVNRYENQTYTKETLPNLAEDEHFQVWMRTAGLPNFRKLYGRNDDKVLKRGNYILEIDMHFNTSFYGGRKAIVISTVGFLGGKNPFLGIAYIAVAVVCVLLGCGFTLRHIYRPR